MPYIGAKELKASDIRRFDVTGSTNAGHTLTWTPPNEQSLIVTINGVKQHGDSYSVSGNTLTLSSSLVATDKLEVIGINDIGTTITPAQNSVDADKIADNAVTTAKIADDQITSAKLANAINIVSGNSLTIDSGATITNNGTASGFGGTNTPYFSVYTSVSQAVASSAWAKVLYDTVHVDSASGFDNSTNYRYTVPSGQGGKYLISATVRGITGSANSSRMFSSVYLNGTSIAENFGIYNGSTDLYGSGTCLSFVYTLAAGDYIENYVYLGGSSPFVYENCWFSAFKLVE